MKKATTLQEVNGNVCLLLDAGNNPLIVAITTGKSASEPSLIEVKAVDTLGNPHFKPGKSYEYGKSMPVGKTWPNVKAYHYEKEQDGGNPSGLPEIPTFSDECPERREEAKTVKG